MKEIQQSPMGQDHLGGTIASHAEAAHDGVKSQARAAACRLLIPAQPFISSAMQTQFPNLWNGHVHALGLEEDRRGTTALGLVSALGLVWFMAQGEGDFLPL